MKRERYLKEKEEVEVSGKAWSGQSRIVRVEFSVDGGKSWEEASIEELEEEEKEKRKYCWVSFHFKLTNLRKGRFVLCCRGEDEKGMSQPLDPQTCWNKGGYCVTSVQRINIVVV